MFEPKTLGFVSLLLFTLPVFGSWLTNYFWRLLATSQLIRVVLYRRVESVLVVDESDGRSEVRTENLQSSVRRKDLSYKQEALPCYIGVKLILPF